MNRLMILSIGLMASLTPPVALAAMPADTSRALKTLMNDGPPESGLGAADSRPMAHGGEMSADMVTVKKGDTLAKILAAHPEILPPTPQQVFKAVVTLNPQAFQGNNPNRMVVGSQLRLPSPAELQASIAGRSMPMAVHAAPSGPSAAAQDAKKMKEGSGKESSGSANYQPDPKAGWPRFPPR